MGVGSWVQVKPGPSCRAPIPCPLKPDTSFAILRPRERGRGRRERDCMASSSARPTDADEEGVAAAVIGPDANGLAEADTAALQARPVEPAIAHGAAAASAPTQPAGPPP